MNNELTNSDTSVVEEQFVSEQPMPDAGTYAITSSKDNFGVQDDQTIKKFLERPLLIASVKAGSFNVEVAPWDSILRNPYVIDKIQHFRFIKGTLNLRITTSCNAYTYGKLLVYNEYGQHLDADVVRGFNAEHRVLDLATKDSCTFTIPLFWKYPYLHTNQWYSYEWERPCITHIIDITQLRQTNAATIPEVVVNVYAWLTDVELAISEIVDYTGQPSSIITTSSKARRFKGKQDPRKRTPSCERPKIPTISKPLLPKRTYPVHYSEPESDIRPVSTPLRLGAAALKTGGDIIQKGTTMAHSALNIAASIASAAGYSRPQAVNNTSGYLPRLFDDTASITGPVQAMNLTLNPETLVTSIHGEGIDNKDRCL